MFFLFSYKKVSTTIGTRKLYFHHLTSTKATPEIKYFRVLPINFKLFLKNRKKVPKKEIFGQSHLAAPIWLTNIKIPKILYFFGVYKMNCLQHYSFVSSMPIEKLLIFAISSIFV